jgi:hypothetical protein
MKYPAAVPLPMRAAHNPIHFRQLVSTWLCWCLLALCSVFVGGQARATTYNYSAVNDICGAGGLTITVNVGDTVRISDTQTTCGTGNAAGMSARGTFGFIQNGADFIAQVITTAAGIGTGTVSWGAGGSIFSITVVKASPSVGLSLSSGTNPSAYGGSLTFTASLTGAASPTGTVDFRDNGASISGCAAASVSGTTATCTTSALAVATHANITAVYSGDAGNNTATSSALSQTVNLANQVALVPAAAPATLAYNATSALSTTGGSGTGAVSYAVTAGAGNCSVAGSTLTAIGVGTCTVTATKAADGNYNVITGTVGVTVTPASQTTLVALATPGSIAFNATTALSTTGGSGTGAVSYAVTAGAGSCSLTGSTLSGIASGTCTVTATKAADIHYSAATATVNLVVGAPPDTELIPKLPVPTGVPGFAEPLQVLNLAGGSGPAMTSCLVDTIRQALGGDVAFVAQAADGAAKVSWNGQVISFYPLSVTSDNQSVGLRLLNSNSMDVATSCGKFSTTPALFNLVEVGSVLNSMGLSAQISVQGVITVLVNGSYYVVRPDYVVTPGTPGTPSLVTGADGILHFTYSNGNRQILRPAILEPATLAGQMQQIGGSVLIQTDGSAQLSLNGRSYVLTPDMILGNVPAGHATDFWWSEGDNRYRIRNFGVPYAASSQGFALTAAP